VTSPPTHRSNGVVRTTSPAAPSLTISTSPLLQDPPSDNFRVIKLLQCVGYRSLLRSLKLGIHWKRQDFASELLGNREVAFMVAHIQVCFLKMQWNRVVKSGLNVSLRKILLDFIASFQADNVEVIDPLAPPCRSLQRCAASRSIA